VAGEPKPTDIKDTLDLVEKAEQLGDGEIEIAADDGGLTALMQKVAKVEDEAEGAADEPVGPKPAAGRPV
jgi:hypothetical protein